MLNAKGRKVSFEQMMNQIEKFYQMNKHYGAPFEIVVGSDSQDFTSVTKIVTAIAIICRGHGGIFFYDIQWDDTIYGIKKYYDGSYKKLAPQIVKIKLNTETSLSIEWAQAIINFMISDDQYREMFDKMPVTIHIDAGHSKKGLTADMINELIGWVHAQGYPCCIKPDSFAASTIADRISK
ncbi:MAG: hypothetical protein J6P61_00815 [Erysipelotrichaceae bacterium]|nr:hypothetical protein [Erysipelotrichaceae bacterium]